MPGSAYSIDGRTFTFELPLADAMPIGGYVQLTAADGQAYLGHLLDESVRPRQVSDPADGGRFITGSGNLLARIDEDGSRPLDGTDVFGSAEMELAGPATVAAHFASTLGSTAGLALGSVQRFPDVPATLHASGFGRHTFLCGQSGSGKTYTLGLVLEQLLLETDIRLAIADPNSDYVSISSLRSQSEIGLDDADYRDLTDRQADVARRIHVFGGGEASRPLRVRFGHLTIEQQTMVLGLDPFAEPDEYNAFVRTVEQLPGDEYSVDDVVAATHSSFDESMRRLGLRIQNLGVADMAIWAPADQRSVRDDLPDDWRAVVIDLGSLASLRESYIAAASLLGTMWRQRHRREATVIVIDEAHNVCPQNPSTPSQALATEHAIRIAGEGRKYGLYLLLSTQRPDKVHQNVMSQCDNLILMRMNSTSDIRTLSDTFSYAPASLVERASGFGLGQGLVAGKIAPDPLLFQTGRRYTVEGGSDVPSTWARSR